MIFSKMELLHNLAKRFVSEFNIILSHRLLRQGVGKLWPATTFCKACKGFKEIIKKTINCFLSSTNFWALLLAITDFSV